MNNIQNKHEVKSVIEAIIFSSDNSVSISDLNKIFTNMTTEQIKSIIDELTADYSDRGIELIQVSDGYRFRTKLEFSSELNQFHQIKPPKYSRTTMEILATITYHQPITRGEIEDIRGVATNYYAIQTLMDRGWIEEIGHKQVPGRPALLATTNDFLNDLGVSTLSELPDLPEIEEFNQNKFDIIESYDLNKKE